MYGWTDEKMDNQMFRDRQMDEWMDKGTGKERGGWTEGHADQLTD